MARCLTRQMHNLEMSLNKLAKRGVIAREVMLTLTGKNGTWRFNSKGNREVSRPRPRSVALVNAGIPVD
jgi:hypothetical protein